MNKKKKFKNLSNLNQLVKVKVLIEIAIQVAILITKTDQINSAILFQKVQLMEKILMQMKIHILKIHFNNNHKRTKVIKFLKYKNHL